MEAVPAKVSPARGAAGRSSRRACAGGPGRQRSAGSGPDRLRVAGTLCRVRVPGDPRRGCRRALRCAQGAHGKGPGVDGPPGPQARAVPRLPQAPRRQGDRCGHRCHQRPLARPCGHGRLPGGQGCVSRKTRRHVDRRGESGDPDRRADRPHHPDGHAAAKLGTLRRGRGHCPLGLPGGRFPTCMSGT